MLNQTKIKKYISHATKLGACGVKLISVDTIVTAPWVRMKCRYGCDGYGQRLTCPPYSPTPEQTANMIGDYQSALLVHGDNHTKLTHIVVKLERQMFLDGYYKAFAMGSGPCRLCDECNLADDECLHAEQARPAMEACGIDVFQTARTNGFPISVVRNRSCVQNYYGIVLIE